jgi:hypothetical protein
LAKSKWKPRREFKTVEAKRVKKKSIKPDDEIFATSADMDVAAFSRDLHDIDKPLDIFADSKGSLKGFGGEEKIKHDSHILMMEWAWKFPDLKPIEFLMERRSYSEVQAKRIINISGGSTMWETEKTKVLDKISETVIKRHIDKMVEVNDQHIAASKLGMAKALEMLTKLNITAELDKDGKINKRTMRSIDLVNIMNAIEKAQVIYRRAMGIPNEESGIAQILEKVAQVTVQNNVQVNNTVIQAAPKSDLQTKMEALDYDDVVELIEMRREMKKKALASSGGSGNDKQGGA